MEKKVVEQPEEDEVEEEMEEDEEEDEEGESSADELMNDELETAEKLNFDFEAYPPCPEDADQINNLLTQVGLC